MHPWAENNIVLSAQYFFWSPGNQLQKSTAGLFRTILVQLLEKQPQLIRKVVNERQWRFARIFKSHEIEWTNIELQRMLRDFILLVQGYAKVLFLIDGIDELEGSDDDRDELVNLLINIATSENVKICLSSRPLNVFRDALGGFPQLKLEDLTRQDIRRYVEAQLHGHVRFQLLLQYNRKDADNFIFEIIHKAAGVFLWVRLVVQQLIKGLRDGDGINSLRRNLEKIPGDLELYFRSLIDSVSYHQRREASALFQIAL
ncbi:hypothetical protein BS50DRAFT_446634, partial [Corynespora cassiicola Philippines]